MESHSISLLIIVGCIVMSAYFSATETAFSSLNRIRIKNMAEKGNRRAALVQRLAGDYDSLLSTILIGNNIVNIACASTATVLFVRLMGEDIGASMSTIVTTIVVLIFGEVSPKSIAKESPEAFAMFSAPLLRIFLMILTPANFLFAQWKRLLSKIFKAAEDTGITEEELLTLVEEAKQEGGIDEQEGSLIKHAIEFTELEAMEVATPRIDVVSVALDEDEEEIARIFQETGYSRLPAYREDLDDIAGIIYQKDFYSQVYRRGVSVETILRPARFITENKRIGDLLKELQRDNTHMAVVVDEFGCTAGLVTLEDILEELVGEIWDEHDVVVKEIEKVSEEEYLIMGKTNLEKVLEELGLEGDFESSTVSGWVMELTQKIPKEGDCFSYQNIQGKVERMQDRRVDLVRLFSCQEKTLDNLDSIVYD